MYPFIGRPIVERRSYLRFGYGAHIIVYSVEPDRVVVRRVLHSSVDVLRHL